MSTAKQSKRTVVGLSLRPDELDELDRLRAPLGDLARSSALKTMLLHLGDAAAQRAQAVQAADVADAESAEPLIDALQDLTDAINARALQRRAIGVHSNQIAKLANVLRAAAERGDAAQVSAAQVDALVHALHGIERVLSQQAAAEREDDMLAASVRAVLTGPRSTRGADAA